MDEDKELFRQLTGGREQEKETPEEVEARRERLRSGEGNLMDAFAERPNAITRAKDHYLGAYGLKKPFTEEEELHNSAMYELMSEEQDELHRRASEAYRKRGFPTRDKNDKMRTLAEFAATNPPEVLRRHIWRLQRGLDDPLFGPEEEPVVNRVKEYEAAVRVHLCNVCAKELREETEESGAERPFYGSKFKDQFYERDITPGFYLFRYEDKYVQREKRSFFDWPAGPPLTCERCGVSDVDLWRDQFGEEEWQEEAR